MCLKLIGCTLVAKGVTIREFVTISSRFSSTYFSSMGFHSPLVEHNVTHFGIQEHGTLFGCRQELGCKGMAMHFMPHPFSLDFSFGLVLVLQFSLVLEFLGHINVSTRLSHKFTHKRMSGIVQKVVYHRKPYGH